jgi:hypothetical protein
MKRRLFPLVACVLASLIASPSLTPEAEAAGSRDKRTIKKLKKQTRGLRKTVNALKADLSDALAEPSIIEMVTVGNVGNAADQDFGDGQFGAVNYEYSIGK